MTVSTRNGIDMPSNLDIENPHNVDTGPGEVEDLLPEYTKLLAQIEETSAQLKAQPLEAVSR